MFENKVHKKSVFSVWDIIPQNVLNTCTTIFRSCRCLRFNQGDELGAEIYF